MLCLAFLIDRRRKTVHIQDNNGWWAFWKTAAIKTSASGITQPRTDTLKMGAWYACKNIQTLFSCQLHSNVRIGVWPRTYKGNTHQQGRSQRERVTGPWPLQKWPRKPNNFTPPPSPKALRKNCDLPPVKPGSNLLQQVIRFHIFNQHSYTYNHKN